MYKEPGNPDLEETILADVDEGMDVYDEDGNEIGEVEVVYLGSVDPGSEEMGEGPATTGSTPHDVRDDSFVDLLADVFAPQDRLPEDVQERLLRSGFIRIDRGIFGRDRYVIPDQIDYVDDEGVHLRTGAVRIEDE